MEYPALCEIIVGWLATVFIFDSNTKMLIFLKLLSLFHNKETWNKSHIDESTNLDDLSVHIKLCTVPPEWKAEPRDASAIAGQSVIIHCQAEGFPQPQITWRKTQGKLLIYASYTSVSGNKFQYELRTQLDFK